MYAIKSYKSFDPLLPLFDLYAFKYLLPSPLPPPPHFSYHLLPLLIPEKRKAIKTPTFLESLYLY